MTTTPALIDHRIYTIHPRKIAQFLDVFDKLAMPVLLETLGRPIGFYVSYVGPLNQVVHLWGYEDMADYERRGRARDTHPDFSAYLKASDGLIAAQEDRLIRRVDLPSLASHASHVHTPYGAKDT